MHQMTLTALITTLLLVGCAGAGASTEVPPHHPAHAGAEQASFQTPPDALPTAEPLAVVDAHPLVRRVAAEHEANAHYYQGAHDHTAHAPGAHDHGAHDHQQHGAHDRAATDHAHDAHRQQHAHHGHADPEALDADGEHALHHALDAYLAIADRLADDSLEGVAAHAGELDRGIADLADAVEGHGAHFGTIRTQAQALAQASDLAAARRAFGELSPAFAHVVESFGAPEGVVVTRFVCGMADAPEGGVWLQRGAEPRNPYFGSRMLRCHRVQAPVPFRSAILDHADHH